VEDFSLSEVAWCSNHFLTNFRVKYSPLEEKIDDGAKKIFTDPPTAWMRKRIKRNGKNKKATLFGKLVKLIPCERKK